MIHYMQYFVNLVECLPTAVLDCLDKICVDYLPNTETVKNITTTTKKMFIYDQILVSVC